MSQEELLAVFNGGDGSAADGAAQPSDAQADAQQAEEQTLFTQEERQ